METVMVFNEPSCMKCGTPRSHGPCACHVPEGQGGNAARNVRYQPIGGIAVENSEAEYYDVVKPEPISEPVLNYDELADQYLFTGDHAQQSSAQQQAVVNSGIPQVHTDWDALAAQHLRT